MTDEEINRKFDVVADHLATFAVGMQRLEESQARTEQRLDRTECIIKLAVSAGLRERRARREQDERINALIHIVDRLAGTVEKMSRKNGNDHAGE